MATPRYRPLALIILLGTFLRVFRLNEVPPGLHYDIASNALLTSRIALDGWRPVFIGAFTGKEVLFFYWAALWFKLLGPSVFAIRLAAATLGILAIPTAYFAVRATFHRERHVGLLALGAALFLAFSFMHVVWSRFGLRAIAEPVTQALAVGFLFRGLRREERTDFALAGLFTGLTAHTYLAARMFPIPLAVGLGVYLFVTSKVERRTSNVAFPIPQSAIRNLTLFTAVAFLVAAPLFAYFLANPETFLVRVAQVAPRGGEGALLARGITGALGMLFMRGEPYDRFNIPGRPIFDPVTGALFVVGVGVTVWRVGRRSKDQGRIQLAAEALLLAWVPVFLLPTALAVHEVFPSNVRAFGLIPLLFVFPARGLLWLITTANGRQWSVVAGPRALRLFGVAAAAAVFALVFRDYFLVWARQPSQFGVNDGDIASAARFVDTQDLAATSVFMSAIHYRHPTVAFLSEQYERIRWLTGGQALAVPANGPALYVFPRSAPPPDQWTASWQDSEYVVHVDDAGRLSFRTYWFADASEVSLPEFKPAYVNFGYFAELTGYRLVAARAGEPPRPGADATGVLVDLRLRVLNVPEQRDFRVVADLVDAWDFHWAQGFNDAYLSEQWQAGDTFIVRLPVAAPAGTPPGEYHLAVTLFAPNSGQNVPALDDAGRAAAAALVGPFQLERAASFENTPVPGVTTDERFGPVALFGYDLHPGTFRPGERIPLALYWQASGAASAASAIVLKLDDLEIERGAPVNGSYPFDAWTPGEVVIDRHRPRIPRELAPGDYKLTLTIVNDAGAPTGALALGTVTVEALARVFDPPSPSHAVDGEFGDVIALTGYDLDAAGPVVVRLYWRSLAETEADYTVFVHLLDSSGALVAQHDGWPQDGAYPTSLWLAGEYVADTHTLAVPPGEYTLAVGLYRPETGERLQLAAPLGSDAFTVPVVVVP